MHTIAVTAIYVAGIYVLICFCARTYVRSFEEPIKLREDADAVAVVLFVVGLFLYLTGTWTIFAIVLLAGAGGYFVGSISLR